jgi:hypothetical protein
MSGAVDYDPFEFKDRDRLKAVKGKMIMPVPDPQAWHVKNWDESKQAAREWFTRLNENAGDTVWVNPFSLSEEEQEILLCVWVLEYYRSKPTGIFVSTDLMKSIVAVFRATEEYWNDYYNILHCVMEFAMDGVTPDELVASELFTYSQIIFPLHSYNHLSLTNIETVLTFRHMILTECRNVLSTCRRTIKDSHFASAHDAICLRKQAGYTYFNDIDGLVILLLKTVFKSDLNVPSVVLFD